MTEENKSKEDQYNEARILHQSVADKIDLLQAKPFLTDDEELEVKLLKKRKLHYKDIMEALKIELNI